MSHARRVVLLCTLLAVVWVPGAAAATTLRISLPPVFEALPIAFAEAWGMFDAEGLSVDVVGITESDARMNAFCTGSLDAMMSDVTSGVVASAKSRSAVVVASAESIPQTGSFRLALVSYAEFGPADTDALLASSDRVYAMLQTDDEYLLDQFFAAHDAPRAWISRYSDALSYINLSTWLSLRMVPMGVLPEPYYSYVTTFVQPSGVSAPLFVVSDLSEFVLPPRVVLFHEEFIRKHPDDVATFLRVYDAAVERINATPRDELIGTGVDAVVSLFFPGADTTTIQLQTLDAMSIPVFESPEPLSEEVFDSVIAWMGERGYVSQPPSFESWTDFSLLP